GRSARLSGAGTSSIQPFSQSPEGEERKRQTVQVVANHEIEGKARARVVLLVPVTVGTLTLKKILGRPLCGQARCGAAGDVRQQRPGRLGGCCRPSAAPRSVGVRADVLAERPARLLDRVEPGERTAD